SQLGIDLTIAGEIGPEASPAILFIAAGAGQRFADHQAVARPVDDLGDTGRDIEAEDRLQMGGILRESRPLIVVAEEAHVVAPAQVVRQCVGGIEWVLLLEGLSLTSAPLRNS